MKRRCTYSINQKSSLEVCKGGPKKDGWLLQISMSGNATFYFIETRDGRILRVHEAYCDLRLVEEDTSFPRKEKG